MVYLVFNKRAALVGPVLWEDRSRMTLYQPTCARCGHSYEAD